MTSVIVVEDLVQQALLESVLRESGVPYVITNAGVQNLLGIGQIGGSNLLAPVEIQVPRAELDRARNLIAAALGESTVDGSALEDPALEEEPEGPQPDEGQAEIQTDEVAARYSRYSVVWAVLWLGGVGSLLAMYFGIRALTLLRSAPATVKTKAIFGVTFGGMGLILWLLIWGTLFRH